MWLPRLSKCNTFPALTILMIIFVPSIRAGAIGPQDAMDAMHGVMMHNDPEQGDQHQAEHAYQRLHDQDKLQAENNIGPNMDDQLHKLAHKVDDPVHHFDKAGPDAPKETGPDDPMQQMHGLLMHGDTEPGLSHKTEDEELQEPDDAEDVPCLDCADKKPHQHGENLQHLLDNMEGENEADDETESEGSRSFDVNPDSILHNEDEDHESIGHDVNPKMKAKFGTFDVDSALHDGAKNVHGHEQKSDDKPGKVYRTYDPERILHKGDDDVHKARDPIELKDLPASGVVLPEHLVHDDNIEGPHDHHEEKKDKKKEHYSEDYRNWLKQRKPSDEDEEQAYGFSFPFISDFVLDEYELVKQRYRNFFGLQMHIHDREPGELDDETDEETEEEVEEEFDEEEEFEDEEETAEYDDEEVEEEDEELLGDDGSDVVICHDCEEEIPHVHAKEDLRLINMNVHDPEDRQIAEELEDDDSHDMREDIDVVGNTKPLDLRHDES